MKEYRLIYPSMLFGQPHKGEARAWGRETKTQIIITQAEVTMGADKGLRCPASETRPYKFSKKNGRKVGSDWRTVTWQIDMWFYIESKKWEVIDESVKN